MNVCTPYKCLVPEEARRGQWISFVSAVKEMVVNCHAGAGNQA